MVSICECRDSRRARRRCCLYGVVAVAARRVVQHCGAVLGELAVGADAGRAGIEQHSERSARCQEDCHSQQITSGHESKPQSGRRRRRKPRRMKHELSQPG